MAKKKAKPMNIQTRVKKLLSGQSIPSSGSSSPPSDPRVDLLENYYQRITVRNVETAVRLEVVAAKVYADSVDNNGIVQKGKTDGGNKLYQSWYDTVKDRMGLSASELEGKAVVEEVVEDTLGLEMKDKAGLEALFKTKGVFRPSELNESYTRNTSMRTKKLLDMRSGKVLLDSNDLEKSEDARKYLSELGKKVMIDKKPSELENHYDFTAIARLVAERLSKGLGY